MGAVMGSKNLKAVAVRGTLDVKLSDPDRYLKYYLGNPKKLMGTKWSQALGKYGTPLLFKYANAMGILSVRNNQFTSIGDQGYLLEAESLENYSTGMLSCFSCPVHCRHRTVIEDGPYKGTKGEGPEYASIGSLGSKLGNLDLENTIYATELCNRYGLDTISTGTYIAWAMELYQRGIINQSMTKIPMLWGDGEAIIEILHMIAQRKGFGDILAEGTFARETLGAASRDYLLEIKDFPIEMTDERLPKSFALGLAVSTRGACHMRSRPSLDVIGLPAEILEKIYGGPVSDQLSSYTGKGRMVWWHELLNAACDALGCCRFLSVFSSPHALQYRQFSRLVDLATGLKITPKALKAVGERIYTLERSMLVRARTEFDRMLDEYYQLHGWDENGVPKKTTLKRLGIDR